jgi:hypothetical protein
LSFAGDGGVSGADADGGAVVIGDVEDGGNTGSEVIVDDEEAPVTTPPTATMPVPTTVVCHQGTTIEVPLSELPWHLQQGATQGPCPS